jgi:hypothetical protein
MREAVRNNRRRRLERQRQQPLASELRVQQPVPPLAQPGEKRRAEADGVLGHDFEVAERSAGRQREHARIGEPVRMFALAREDLGLVPLVVGKLSRDEGLAEGQEPGRQQRHQRLARAPSLAAWAVVAGRVAAPHVVVLHGPDSQGPGRDAGNAHT